MPQFKYRASGTYVIASQGTGTGAAGYQVTVTPRESWVGSLVFKQNIAPPGSTPNYVSVAYQDADTAEEVAAGTAITATAALIISPTVGDLVVVYTHTSGEIVLNVNPATTGVTNSELRTAFLAAGYETAGQNTPDAMLSVAVADMLGTTLNVKAFGAVGDGDEANASRNKTAIRAAIAAAASGAIKAVYIPSGTYVTDDNFTLTSAHSNVTIFGDGASSCIKLADSPNVGNVEAGWMVMFNDTSTLIRNVRISGLRLDGSKDTTSWATTSYGIIVRQNSLLQNCQADNLWTHDYRTSGVQMLAGGLRVSNVNSYNNTFHGVGVSIASTFGDEVAEVYNVTGEDNGGYGVDFSKGRTIAANIVCRRNTQGGSKVSENCEYLQLDNALLEDNVGPGFLNTGNAANLELLVDNIVCRNNGGRGFRIGTGKIVRIGSLACISNQTAGTVGPDILLGADSEPLTFFDARSLYVEGSPAGGVLVDGAVVDYTIGHITAVSCETYGFRDSSTGPTRGCVLSGIFRNNNQAGTAGADGSVYWVETAGGSHVSSRIVFFDTQGSPTQISGMRFTNTVKAEVNLCDFGTGISAGGQIYSSTAGTVVRFGHNNTGLVTRARGTITGNGGGTTLNATYPTAISGIGGLVYFAQVTPSSLDASPAHYIASTTNTALGVTWAVATAGGVNNVSYSYDVVAEVQR